MFQRFEKVFLQPGEVKTIEFKITQNDLSFIGLDNKRIVESGDFVVTIENKTANFVLK